MTYTFQCPACSKKIEVETDNDEDAVNKIEEMLNLVKTQMQKS